MKKAKEEIRVQPDSIFDSFKEGRLAGRDIHKADISYSMSYDSTSGTFYGSVTQGKDRTIGFMYHSSEPVCEKWAKLPYPELNELRDLLIKEWADDIKKHLAKKPNKD